MKNWGIPYLLILGLIALLISYYISEYTHITHTSRLLTRKIQPKHKKLETYSVKKILDTDSLQALDPFLQFFHATLSPGEGLPDHAHRGYDTITYVLSGELIFEDFRNNSGVLYKGDTQWLTAGRGIVHTEYSLKGCEFIQVWINLKMSFKFVEYSYQHLKSAETLVVSEQGVTVKIIAGETLGRVGYTITRNPAYVFDVAMENKTVWNTDIPEGWNCFMYMLNGTAKIHDDFLETNEVALLSQWDTDLEVRCIEKCRIFLVASETVEEMLVRFGQFYMPNYPLADEANKDLKTGKNGFEGSTVWKSRFK